MLTRRPFDTSTPTYASQLDFSTTVEFTVITFIAFDETKAQFFQPPCNGSSTKA